MTKKGRPKSTIKTEYTKVHLGKDRDGNDRTTNKAYKAGDEKDRQRVIREAKEEFRRKNEGPETFLFKDVVKRWLKEKEEVLDSDSTVLSNNRNYARILNARFGNRIVSDITYIEFKELMKLYIENAFMFNYTVLPDGTRDYSETYTLVKRKSNLSERTIREFSNAIKQVFSTAKAMGQPAPLWETSKIIIPNTASKAKPRRALTYEEILSIIDTPHRLQLPAMIMIFSGLRPSEAAALTWKDIHIRDKSTNEYLELPYIDVYKSINCKNGRVKNTKTINGNRTACIPPVLVKFLENYYNEHSPKDDDYIFYRTCIKPNGEVVHKPFIGTTYDETIISYRKALNRKYGYKNQDVSNIEDDALIPKIDYFTCYDFRHTFITMLILMGYNPSQIYEVTGHSPKTCEDLINRIYRDHNQTAANVDREFLYELKEGRFHVKIST